jgi:hypothetical protein
MEEMFCYLSVDFAVEQAMATIVSAFPHGLRSDGTISGWRGIYRQEDDNGHLIIMRSYCDGYGNTMVVLCENMSDSTRVAVVVSPENRGTVASRFKSTLADALDGHIIDSDPDCFFF